MQKNNIKGSIFIWAIFLSLIISVSFIQISTKINKILNNNKNFVNDIQLENNINNLINNSIINKDFTKKTLENWDKIIFYNESEIEFSLKKDRNHKSKINTWSNLQVTILEWWPIKYENNSSSWIINEWKIFSVTNWDLNIINLWWYTRLKINSNTNENFLSEFIDYKIIKKIWNKEIIQKKWKIKSF